MPGDLEPHDDSSFDDEHRHPRQPVERLVDPRLAARMLCWIVVP
jgi:hypothetical protein